MSSEHRLKVRSNHNHAHQKMEKEEEEKNPLAPSVNRPRGGHSIVKLNTMCEQSLLPLYYMTLIILKFMILFLHIYNH